MATTSFTPVTLLGRNCIKGHETLSASSFLCDRTTTLTIQRKPNQQKSLRKLAICAKHNGAVDFIAGFLFGGVVCGTLAYAFAPKMREYVYDTYSNGFAKPKPRKLYGYDGYYGQDEDEDLGGLEKTKQTLKTKIKQLGKAIDNVTARLTEEDDD